MCAGRLHVHIVIRGVQGVTVVVVAKHPSRKVTLQVVLTVGKSENVYKCPQYVDDDILHNLIKLFHLGGRSSLLSVRNSFTSFSFSWREQGCPSWTCNTAFFLFFGNIEDFWDRFLSNIRVPTYFTHKWVLQTYEYCTFSPRSIQIMLVSALT